MAISFKRAHVPPDIILMGVRWYVAYPLSDRQVEELMAERGVAVDHATIQRWVVQYRPQLGSGLSPPQAARLDQLADGRNLSQSERRVEVLVPCGGQVGPDHGLSAHGDPRYRGGVTFSDKGNPS